MDPMARLRGLLAERRVTHLQLGRALGMSESRIQKNMTGAQKWFRGDSERAAQHLGIDHDTYWPADCLTDDPPRRGRPWPRSASQIAKGAAASRTKEIAAAH